MNTTNNELIEFAKDQCEIFPEDSYMGKYLRETLKMLQAESCGDCVSRESLIHKLQERHDFFVDAYGGFSNLPQKDKARVDAISNCIAMVVNEPPVKPTRKKGKWINKSHTSGCGIKFVASECTCCGKKTFFDCDQLVYNYCPNCGAEMKGEET